MNKITKDFNITDKELHKALGVKRIKKRKTVGRAKSIDVSFKIKKRANPVKGDKDGK